MSLTLNSKISIYLARSMEASIAEQNKNVQPGEDRNGLDDVWTFIALDRKTKVIPSFIVGKRDLYHARVFMEDLASRLKHRVQISSDALAAYPEAVERGFGSEVDYAQLAKPIPLSIWVTSRKQPLGTARLKLCRQKRRLLLVFLTKILFARLTLRSRITLSGCIAEDYHV